MTKPISVTSRPISEHDRAVIAEKEAITRSVGELTFAWAGIENAMVFLFANIIGRTSHLIASAIYFAPAGLEVRQKLVDAAVETFVKTDSKALERGSEIGKLILHEWGAIQNKINHLRKTRNKVAHGELALPGGLRGSGMPRLTSPLFKFDDEPDPKSGKLRKAGMGSNEITQSATAARELVNRILQFNVTLERLRRRDSEALLRTLASEANENPSPPDPDNQIPLVPESPPLPSEG